MSNFETFFAANASTQQLVTTFAKKVALKRERARTDASSRKWQRAVSLAWGADERLRMANEYAMAAHTGAHNVLAFHGSTEAATQANPWIGEQLQSALTILDNIKRDLSRYTTIVGAA